MEAQNGKKNGSRNGSPKCVTNSKAVAFRVDECITTFSNATESQQSNGTKTIRPQTTFQVTHHKSPSWGVSLPAPTDTEHVEFVCIRPFLLMNNINKVDSSRNPPFVHELRQNNMSYPKPAGSGELCSSWTLAQVEAKHLAAAAACSGMGWLTTCVLHVASPCGLAPQAGVIGLYSQFPEVWATGISCSSEPFSCIKHRLSAVHPSLSLKTSMKSFKSY